MTIKLSDHIKNPENVFTEEEAKEIYESAGYIENEELGIYVEGNLPVEFIFNTEMFPEIDYHIKYLKGDIYEISWELDYINKHMSDFATVNEVLEFLNNNHWVIKEVL